VTEPPPDSTTDQVTDWMVEFITVAVKLRSALVARMPLGPEMVMDGAGGGGAGALPEPHPESSAAESSAAKRIKDMRAGKRERGNLDDWAKGDICDLAGSRVSSMLWRTLPEMRRRASDNGRHEQSDVAFRGIRCCAREEKVQAESNGGEPVANRLLASRIASAQHASRPVENGL